MRKILTFVASTFITGSLLAGGLVTNTNHSAMYTRLQCRNASTVVDAVYYNPAGLTKLQNGLSFSVNSQTIGQNISVLSDYPYLRGTPPREYTGTVSAPFFPGIYAAYKTGKLVFSAGFNPVGGGGGAEYKTGLPSFEMQIADLKPLLSSMNIPTTQYDAGIYFKGSETYLGYQANVSYEINDMFSVAAGVRLVTASNAYTGYLKKIEINPNYPAFGAAYTGVMVLASDFFTSGATTLNGLAASSTSAATGLLTAISGGVPATTPLSAMPPATVAGVTQLLGAAGISAAGMNIGTAAATLNAVAPVFTANANTMTGYATATQDVEVDAEESGTGYTPILSVNFAPSEKLNIALKYEFKTKLELTTKVIDNKGGGVFTDGEKVIADMPAMLALGASYIPLEKLMVTAGMNYYFDKGVDYDGSESLDVNMIDKNLTEYALGVEYRINEELRISAGWLGTFAGVNSDYQSDRRFDVNTNSFGGGFGFRVNKMIDLNLGAQYTFYKEEKKNFDHMLGTNPIPAVETYNKNTWVVAVGIDLYFGKSE